jgi:filamentous hemagglutinin family protein
MPTSGLQAGDILRGGASAGNAKRNADARANAGAAAAEAAKVRAQDRLARTTKAVNDMRALQSSARAAAGANAIPNGITEGGLRVLTGANAKWQGANAPVQSGNTVNIKQTAAQALLHWDTFNVGSQTTVNFDQSAGGADSGKWIAFNKVFDPDAKPSEIRGKINAQGQVYIINQNGIIFGAGSQVNARTLVASSLPINDNLVANGLLNNRNAEFLFSKDFANDPTATFGDIVVERGALLSSPEGEGGNGGRIMLVGANVRNAGEISTPSGQAILAAGLQVGAAAHAEFDPSLRGLDVWVGDVGSYGGTVANSGLIESQRGSIVAVGKQITQSGVLESSTSVNLNGRIDLLASYGAVGFLGYDSSFQPPFLNRSTGIVEFAPGGTTRILPDFSSDKKIPGTKLAQSSQVNIEGLGIHFAGGSSLIATSGAIGIRAGTWPFVDTNNDGIVTNATEAFQQISNGRQRFLLSGGQVNIASSALLDASGTMDAFVPLANNFLAVQLRGSELADSPLQRSGGLRGKPLLVDLRRSGSYGGRGWIGTPLGDLTGFANITERDIAQLTTRGGSISIAAGDSVVAASGATIDVSGGYFTHEGGLVKTTRLLRDTNLVDMHNAVPDVTYDGIYDGLSSYQSTKWGTSSTYTHALAPLGGGNERSHVEGASAGRVDITAPKMALAAELLGQSITGPRQQATPAGQGILQIKFQGETKLDLGGSSFVLGVKQSPNAPNLVFSNASSAPSGFAFELVSGAPVAMPFAAGSTFAVPSDWWDEEGGGFGNISIDNSEGDITIPTGSPVELPAGGSLTLVGRNISLNSNISVPGGSFSATAYNFTPLAYDRDAKLGLFTAQPAPIAGQGIIRVAPGVVLDVAGQLIDERPSSETAYQEKYVLKGGAISLSGYSVLLGANSLVDASGGVRARPNGKFQYGNGGSISLLAGKDPSLSTTVGGELNLGGVLQSYSVAKGGSLAIQANAIQIGGNASPKTLLLEPAFFRSGGFTSYALTGIGTRAVDGSLVPGVRVAAGTIIEPAAESWRHMPSANARKLPQSLARLGDQESKNTEALISSLSSSADTRPLGMKRLGTDALFPVLLPEGLRQATSLTLSATGYDDSFTEDRVEATGLIDLQTGSKILTDAGASVRLTGDLVRVASEISAPGGNIEITGRSSFRLPSTILDVANFAMPTVHITGEAKLSVAGKTIPLDDPYGWNAGIIHPGGTIKISGNILAESGSTLNASGTTAILDLHPSRLDPSLSASIPANTGLNTKPWQTTSVAVRLDSDGGRIELNGSQMLYVDSALQAKAGGDSAGGGTLSISSGRFYSSGESRTGADTNLLVAGSGSSIRVADTGALSTLANAFFSGDTPESVVQNAFASPLPQSPGIGFFATDTFTKGGFDHLDLGFKYFKDAFPIAIGGNLEFLEPVSLEARGSIRLAGGGVIRSPFAISIASPYVSIGQISTEPLHPSDVFAPFREYNASNRSTPAHKVAPTAGTGSIQIVGDFIDIGTLVTKESRFFSAFAFGGEIRGNGIVSVSGDVILQASQIYPTTLNRFEVFAYDTPTRLGSIVILGAELPPVPLSAGGHLGLHASVIRQAGTLRAPLGSIALGWDGRESNKPENPVVSDLIASPRSTILSLEDFSVTSVSGFDPLTNQDVLFPFGISPDGQSWIDPRGVDVTTTGLPSRGISVMADEVYASPGSVLDTRGGGDLFAYRWIPGLGGSRDLLGTATSAWSATKDYEAGDLVTHSGKSWSARSKIEASDFTSSPAPSEGTFWSLLPESYAILPNAKLGFAPVNTFNTGVNSGSLAGDPGFIAPNLRTGETIYLSGNAELEEGFYSLLPRRYGLLPNAMLVIPVDSAFTGTGSVRTASSRTRLPSNRLSEDGSNFISGHTTNAFNFTTNPIHSRYEILLPEQLAERAEYQVTTGNQFFESSAKRVGFDRIRLLPKDSAALQIQGNQMLALSGLVFSRPNGVGQPGLIDVSSNANIEVTNNSQLISSYGNLVLQSDVLNSWDAGSLLIGGVRTETSSGFAIDARAASLKIQTPRLSASEVTLVSKGQLEITAGSSIFSNPESLGAGTISVTGDGTLVRISSTQSQISRTGTTGSSSAILKIGKNAELSGTAVTLDSSRSALIDPSLKLSAESLALGAGQISMVFDPRATALAGSQFDTHLILKEGVLLSALATRSLTLQSYTTIDFYANESINTAAKSLTFLASGLRTYINSATTLGIAATDITFSNPNTVTTLAAPASIGGTLEMSAKSLAFGQNAFSVSGISAINISATNGVSALSDGTFSSTGSLRIATPSFTARRAVAHSISSTGTLELARIAGTPNTIPEVGASISLRGSAITLDSDIILPSGSLEATATDGSITVSGFLSVAGSSKAFFDQTRYTNGGDLVLDATDAVRLLVGSQLSVAAASGGGDAGSLTIKSPGGPLVALGTLNGGAPAGRKGSFSLDASLVGSLDALATALTTAGFTRKMDFRIRTGDISIGSNISAKSFLLSADGGSITISSQIDASDQTGGRIELIARNNLTFSPTGGLTVAAHRFGNAGKGGHIHLEAGSAINGSPNTTALLDLQSGSKINLSVSEFVTGDYTTAGSSAFNGKFQGTLHLRAPRNGNDVLIDQIDSTITGASSISVEPFQIYEPTDGTMDILLRTTINNDNASFMNAGEATMLTRLLPGGSPLRTALVITPGVEILNRTGDLTLGVANNSNLETTDVEALSSADWDLSDFRYGARSTPGILTLRAAGDLIFNNTLSDGFEHVDASADNGWSSMWLATPSKIDSKLPTNLQSWSFNLTAGADFSSVDSGSVVPSTGKVLVGEAHSTFSSQAISNDEKPATQNPNKISGDYGRTLNHIKINPTLNRGNRYEVIRTGTGDIQISAGSDVQLRNAFSAIYTSGVALPNASRIFEDGDFSIPVTSRTGLGLTPPVETSWDDPLLGTPQQNYKASFTISGGDLNINSMRDIGRYADSAISINPYFDSNNQLPSNWLYRRGELSTTSQDSAGNPVFVGGSLSFGSGSGINDASASTSWWIDYSNFFGAVGAMGGGSVQIAAERDIVNLNASVPTTARMAGLSSGSPITASINKLWETGGGDLELIAGRNILSGSYYVERGNALLVAGREIKPIIPSSEQEWTPATLFGGDTRFSLVARSDIEVGPASNAFLLPQGLNNRLWYRTHFHTINPSSSIDVRSFGGGITHRLTYAEGVNQSDPFLWHIMFKNQGVQEYQPWTRFLETDLSLFKDSMSVSLPILRSYSFGGDIAVVGKLNLFPSAKGELELLANNSLNGLNPSGWSDGQVSWITASLNLSDANPTQFSSIEKPLSGRAKNTDTSYFNIASQFNETGSFIGDKASIDVKSALHNPSPLHSNNPNPVLLYASGGDISGLTLYSAKKIQTLAQRDITDIAFYLQHPSSSDISIVSAGRDIIPFNENHPPRALASDITAGNVIIDAQLNTLRKDALGNPVKTQALPGDIQIGGQGVLEVLAGRNIDLGTGPNLVDGRGKGITSIGRSRNPFLPFDGAEIVILAGVGGKLAGPALGLANSVLDFSTLSGGAPATEIAAVTALKNLFKDLAKIGEAALETNDYSAGFALVDSLFRSVGTGDLFTRARDIRTASGGAITVATPGGGVTMASDIFGNPLTPPGVVTEYGGAVSILTKGNVEIGQARIFTLRGGDLTIWSTSGDIAAGNAPKTVVTAPPTRVLIDATSADIQTDLGGLATGGGIGVLAAVEGVEEGAVNLIAPSGTVDAGDAGIRATGDIKIAAAAVVNADNISAGGTSTGVPSAPTVAAPNIGGLTSGSSSSAAASSAASQVSQQSKPEEKPADETPSLITVEVLGYGGGDSSSEKEDEETSAEG